MVTRSSVSGGRRGVAAGARPDGGQTGGVYVGGGGDWKRKAEFAFGESLASDGECSSSGSGGMSSTG